MSKRGKKRDEDEALSEGDEPPKKSSKPSAAAVDNYSADSDYIVVCELPKNRTFLSLEEKWRQISSPVLILMLLFLAMILRHLLALDRNTITHIFREGNQVADLLASEGWDRRYYYEYSSQDLPRRHRSLVQIDRFGLPTVRGL
ncbi:RNA polymerase II transcriptional coactivator KIWI [Abeliophyllum distichum]|uniref:RNA polymerase II transcriptional coactivator KIWI n=1 Tax=Abeliophyllum distichum TaxID=126358 RepID=A0ABD1V9E7_9LAMI